MIDISGCKPGIIVAGAFALACMGVSGCAPQSDAAGSAGSGSVAETAAIGARQDTGGTPTSTAISFDSEGYLTPDEKWASYDDGSDLLDIAEANVYANAVTSRLTVNAVSASFASEMTPDDISLIGGLASWSVEEIERTSDTQVVVTLSNPDSGYAAEGSASTAGLVFAGGSIEIADGDGAQPTGEVTVTIPCVHPYLAIDVQETRSSDSETVYRFVASDFVFADDLSADDFQVVAEHMPEGMEAPRVVAAELINEFECEVTVTGDATAEDAPHHYAALVLSADASGTGGTVGTSLLVPDVWTDVQLSEVDGLDATALMMGSDADVLSDDPSGTKVGTAMFEVTVYNSDELASSDNTHVRVGTGGGSLVDLGSATLSATDDGRTLLTVDCSEVREALGEEADSLPYAVLDIDVSAVDHASEGSDDPYRAAVLLPLTYEYFASSSDVMETLEAPSSVDGTALVTTGSTLSVASMEVGGSALHSISASDTAASVSSSVASGLLDKAKTALGAISGIPWGRAIAQLAPDAPLADPSNAMLYQKLNEAIAMLNTINETTVKTLETVKANYDAGIVNDANKTIRRIQSDCTLLNDWYLKILATPAGSERTAVADAAMAAQSGTINDLFLSMEELYGLLEHADARTGKGLLPVYLSMAEASNNWEGQAVSSYRVLTAEVATIWRSATEMTYVVCGSSSQAESYRSMLNALEDNTKQVGGIITAADLPDSTYMTKSWKFTSNGVGDLVNIAAGSTYAYKCIYTGEWYIVVRGDQTTRGWDDPWYSSKRKGGFYTYTVNGPFCTLTGGDKSAFKSAWSSMYLTTDQAKGMVEASHSGTESLQSQIDSFAGEGTVPASVLTSAGFGNKGLEVNGSQIRNDHKFDTFGSDAGKSTFTADQIHYKAYETDRVFKKNVKHFESSTALSEICALAKVAV